MASLKQEYDVVVIGAGTAGCYFAHEMATNGYSVCVIDGSPIEDMGKKLYLFHTDKERFDSYGVPEPKPGDEDYIGLFEYGITKSAFDKYPKRADYPFTVALLPPFLKRMRVWAESGGAEFHFATPFENLIYSDDGKIEGVEVKLNDEIFKIKSRLVVDCSGIPSVARRKLKKGKIETFEIGPRDKFYVILRYAKIKDPKDYVKLATGWAYYKSWIGPAPTPDTAIIGIGANLSFEYAEKCFQRFSSAIKLPEYEVERIEKGSTPYRRAPYSLVSDGFICLGDAACMTKPYSGEGITSGWVGCRIAAEIASEVMKNGAYPTEEKLWAVNHKYNTTQAADFAYLMATLINAIECTPEENDYEFKKDIVFSSKAMSRMNRKFNADMPFSEVLQLVGRVVVGIFSGNISMKTVKQLLKGISYAGKLKSHYKKFPKTVAGYEKWKAKADALWIQTGSMADVVERMESKNTIK
ncbi:MAG: NAD(P)/FAD-dependent oxidoreductase [Christensenellaceae bacterium]|jgi:electron-transferring-flavoprotein dehydrogenase|nr:NAD(P)/FAD-dependent oxidoreductase [Christensenellaceae bacterium]